MDAFDKLGTICLILTCFLMVPFAWYLRSNTIVMGLFVLCFAPILWIAGLQVSEFLTKPFSEKGLKGFFSWVIAIIISLIVYGVFFVALMYLLDLLQLTKK